jgi:hypothetical protein
MRDYKLIFSNRKQAEVLDFEEFHNYHFPGRPFKYRNKWNNIDGMFEFDSALKSTANSRQRAEMEVAIRQVPYSLDALTAVSESGLPLDGDFLIEG